MSPLQQAHCYYPWEERRGKVLPECEQQLVPALIIALAGLASVEAQQEVFASGIDLFN